MPYALQTIYAPGSYAAGYRTGDEVSPIVIENWGLVEGEHYTTDQPVQDAPAAPAVPRPADDTDRAAWVAYAVANGADPDEAADMSLDDLMQVEGDSAVAGTEPERPADSARKADWVLYVNNHPEATAEDQAWAGDDTTTKAELQAWSPRPTDPVAESATEANQA